VASFAGIPPREAEHALNDLWRRRLVIREDNGYV
jgi:hypothetical protein